MEKIVRNIVKQIKEKTTQSPKIAIILGSGLDSIAEQMENSVVLPYDSLEGMPKSKAEGHKNQFVVGNVCGKSVITMQGRLHLYDGLSAKQVALPIYIFKELGVETVIITNASGGIRDDLNSGDLLLLVDHINHTNTNALIGGPIIDYGKQFIDMTEPYDVEYRNLMLEIAKQQNANLKQGTYMQVVGPFYETKADIQMAKVLGADAIGMSTVIEVECARQCELRVLGISLITNKAAGLSQNKLSHSEVLEVGQKASKKLVTLINNFVKELW